MSCGWALCGQSISQRTFVIVVAWVYSWNICLYLHALELLKLWTLIRQNWTQIVAIRYTRLNGNLAGVQNHNYIQHHDVMQQVLIALWYKCCCYGISRNKKLQEGHVYQEYHQGIIVSNAVWLKDDYQDQNHAVLC